MANDGVDNYGQQCTTMDKMSITTISGLKQLTNCIIRTYVSILLTHNQRVTGSSPVGPT